ncbi:VOC family protein [Streptacidiphilus melanogenes]|uniref:VOC family protein n=1 Tax=Streptacidiphilus melanogenes TaxID=411235 RepID=UPI00191BF71E|nr:VOC family protein [Streptacidiphilus melanogenes]
MSRTSELAGAVEVVAVELAWVLDCADPPTLASFWAGALGYTAGPYRQPYLELSDPRGHGPELLLQRVPEPKRGKNRMHVDLRVQDQDTKVERLVELGGRLLRPPFDDTGWWTAHVADPEGNELCVIVPPRP